MEDLTTDSAAIPEVRTTACEEEETLTKANNGNFSSKNRKMPQEMHLSGCSKIHIGPLYNCIDPASVRTPPPGASSPLNSFGGGDVKRCPSKPHVEALLATSREINDEDVDIVSTHLGYKWRDVGRLMNYSEGQLDNIDADCHRLNDKAYKLLCRWRDREANLGSVANLTRLLMKAGAFDTVNHLQYL